MTDPKETGYTRGPQPDVKAKPNVALIAGIIVIVACAIVFVRNDHQVSLDFLFYEKTTTVRWAVLMAIVLGVLLDRAFTIWWRRRRRKNDDD
ncbi:MAG: hypothetical protein F2681_00385 [Actinobacteria bacterium]|uniref:Unannotated protein n=1 Tax=freshwater metagenome TaxID=449393 RepID=A0A6J6PVZ5_9ZZZZ|nr:hypothetical protein [Actinomycetota bacterium]MSW77893.1 hypothetical protein [Actinomycetota bacterium]MSX54866.1 hypothetical protein [Actinomycetota bacterium]MSX92478.1 hypothetical protein [Actinomycetota bacterium]MSZ81578.1 hypothetical protein [Actinomycetota bacterium]